MRHSGASCGAPASRGAPREDCDDRVFQLHLLRADAGVDRPGAGPADLHRRRHRGAGNGPHRRAGRSRTDGQNQDRRAPPFPAAGAPRGAEPAQSGRPEMVGADVARRHGQERDRDRGALPGPAGHLVGRQPGIPRAQPRDQRIRRQARARSSRPLRPVRHDHTSRPRRRPEGDRTRLRHTQGRWHRPVDELQRQISWKR